MAIWRSPALEALLGGPVDGTGLTEDPVLRLVAAGARESDELELKRDPYPAAPPGRPLAWTKEQVSAYDLTCRSVYGLTCRWSAGRSCHGWASGS